MNLPDILKAILDDANVSPALKAALAEYTPEEIANATQEAKAEQEYQERLDRQERLAEEWRGW